MGDPLAQEIFNAFGEELVKEAFSVGQVGRFVLRKALHPVGQIGRGAKGFLGETGTAAERFFNPVKGMREGWKGMSNVQPVTKAVDKIRNLQAAKATAQRSGDPAALAAATKELQEAGKAYAGTIKGKRHLLRPSQSLAEAAATPGLRAKGKAIAEELSRRGWTGAGGKGVTSLGGATKYLPVGQKGQMALIGAAGIPGVVDAAKATPTGEGAALERGGRLLGSVGGMALSGGLGLVPALGLWLGAEHAGSRAGRVLDRIRAGGTAGQALTAPSPEEAQAQLANIQRHYG
jgi:hypothetical protein